MSGGSKSGPASRGGVAYPWLLECGSHIHVLWVSERSRLALGGAENPIDTIMAGARSRVDARVPAAVSAGLLHLETSLLRHYLRLQLAEHGLSTLARNRRGGVGRGAVRQVELERQRLGRELHTGLGQMLAAIRLQIEIVATLLPDPPALVQQALSRISTLANDALQQVRSVSGRLYPPEWQRLTLADALQQLWDSSGIPQRFTAALRIQPLPHEAGLEVKVLVYRAAQEALSNVARHARATRVDAALETRDDCVILTIRDDGVGFDIARLFRGPPNIASGVGLRSIREHAAALGGKLEIESGPAGTRLVVSVPFS